MGERERSVAVIGGGPMGLTTAYEIAKTGVKVTLFEQAERLGGMSVQITFDGTRLERYYHFVCGPDETTFKYLDEFGLGHRLKWRETHLGFYYGGKLHDWGNPLALLRFPHLSLAQKIRYGLHVLQAKNVQDWSAYENRSAASWIQEWVDERTYAMLWQRLFELKFYEYQDNLSAAWIGTRIKRIALSRKSMFEERLGYLEGGSEILIEAAAHCIQDMGGKIRTQAAVEHIKIGGQPGAQKVQGVIVDGRFEPFDQVISTIPLPYLVKMAPDLPPDEAEKVANIVNVGVVCVLLKLKRQFTRNFWLNVNDPDIDIPGLIEFTNLNPLDGSHILYAPFYMPQTHPKYARDGQAFIDETIAALKRIRPDFTEDDVVAATSSRYHYAQPVCTPGFAAKLPPMQSAVEGLYMADTSHYYPEDRSISESMRVGGQLARMAAAT